MNVLCYNFCFSCGAPLTENNRVDLKGFEGQCHGCYSATKPKTVCLDFDGVIAQYTSWQGPEHCGKPLSGLADFLNKLRQSEENWRVIVHTTRNPEVVWSWLRRYGFVGLIHGVTNTKPAAVAYIDDRAICFRGSFTDTLTDLNGFKPWWKPMAAPVDPK